MNRYNTLQSVLLIFGVCVLSYGLLIPFLGLYWDDWNLYWATQTGTDQYVLNYFSVDRPLIGHIYNFTKIFLGETIVNYHIFAFVGWVLLCLTIWILLKTIWPRNQKEA